MFYNIIIDALVKTGRFSKYFIMLFIVTLSIFKSMFPNLFLHNTPSFGFSKISQCSLSTPQQIKDNYSLILIISNLSTKQKSANRFYFYTLNSLVTV